MATDPERVQGTVNGQSAPDPAKPSARRRWQKALQWSALGGLVATPVFLYVCRERQIRSAPGSLSEAVSNLGRDFPQYVIVPPSGGTHLGKLVQDRLDGRRLTLQPLTCFRVTAPREEPSLNVVEVKYTGDRELTLELGGQIEGVPVSTTGSLGGTASVQMKLEQMRTRTGVGIPDQVACNFTDGMQLDVVTSEAVAGSVSVVSEGSASQTASATLAKLSKTAQGWKSVDAARLAGENITVFAGLTRVNVQLAERRHDLGARPVSRSISVGAGGTTATVTAFDFGQRLLTVRVSNDTGYAPTTSSRCRLNEPVVLSGTDRCVFELGPNATVLLWWEIEQRPYRKVVLGEKLLRTTTVSLPPPSGSVPEAVGESH